MKIVYLSLLLLVVTVVRTGRKSCITANYERGECLDIEDCPNLLSMIKLSKENATIKQYLRGSVCEYEGKKPIICCPRNNDEDWSSDDETNFDDIFLNPPNCGVSQHKDEARIVGGKPTHIGDWPWEVAIGYQKIRGRKITNYHCGGALISDQYVLTAAHCNKDKSLKLVSVRMGVVNLISSTKSKVPPMDINIATFIPHESYSSTDKNTGDIALIKLAKKVKFNKYVQPICLPIASNLRHRIFVNDSVYVAGWGTVGYRKKASTKQLEINLPVLSNSVCEEAFLKFGVRLTNKNLCAGYLSGEKDACQGDSGGPLMFKQNGITYTIGVVSFGFKCAERGYPGVYTKVSAYINWIAEKIKL